MCDTRRELLWRILFLYLSPPQTILNTPLQVVSGKPLIMIPIPGNLLSVHLWEFSSDRLSPSYTNPGALLWGRGPIGHYGKPSYRCGSFYRGGTEMRATKAVLGGCYLVHYHGERFRESLPLKHLLATLASPWLFCACYHQTSSLLLLLPLSSH